jgi:hypothetical protein
VRKTKVDLSEGNWAEIRDKLKGKDKFAVQQSISFDVDNASQKVSADLMTTMTNALLAKLITTWSFPDPVPGDTDDPGEVLGELDIDDYNALEDAARPMLSKVLQTPNRATPSG